MIEQQLIVHLKPGNEVNSDVAKFYKLITLHTYSYSYAYYFAIALILWIEYKI